MGADHLTMSGPGVSYELDTGEADESMAARLVGLNTKASFVALAAGAPAETASVPKPAPKKRKKKKGAAGAMSFDVGEDEDDNVEIAPKKKLCNPSVDSGFLKKREWMSNEEKQQEQHEENQKVQSLLRQRAEAETRPLELIYTYTMRPQGPAGNIVKTMADPESEEMIVEEKPPRKFKNRKVTVTWGDTPDSFFKKAREDLSQFLGVEKARTQISQNLMFVDGHMICPEVCALTLAQMLVYRGDCVAVMACSTNSHRNPTDILSKVQSHTVTLP